MYIDTHAHYHLKQMEARKDALFELAKEAGVGVIVNSPIALEDNFTMRKGMPSEPIMYYSAGMHPSRVTADMDPEDIKAKLILALLNMDVSAIGECGLDYHVPGLTKEVKGAQRLVFLHHIDLATDYELPLVLHIREQEDGKDDAFQDAMCILLPYKDLLRHNGHGGCAGVVHCFHGNEEQAKAYTEFGFMLGIGGKITGEDEAFKQAVISTPLEYLVLETDAPYLTPKGCEGINHSGNIPVIAQIIAELKHIDVRTVEDVTTANAFRLFGLNASL